MTWLQVIACFLAVSSSLSPTLAAICPDSCVCATTRDGLHRATCSDIIELYKFTLRQKHHNINILDLSHNNITKLNHELDRLTEVVTLDLSTNGIQHLNKFLHNAKKLVHLNLANNRMQEFSLIHLPTSVSSLDLTNNLLTNAPSDIGHLVSLEHLEMAGNPLDCSCENLISRDRLLISNVLIDNVKCASPSKFKGRSWLELKTKEICKAPKADINYLDMMMGDQPIDAMQVGQENTALKSLPLVASSDLEDGNVIQGGSNLEEDDSQLFLKVRHATSSPLLSETEGSGDGESTTISEIYLQPRMQAKLDSSFMTTEEIIPAHDYQTTTEDPTEGSGEGSGFLPLFEYDSGTERVTEATTEKMSENIPTENGFVDKPTTENVIDDGITDLWEDYDFDTSVKETTTEKFVEINPGPIERIFEDDIEKGSTEFPLPEIPSVYQGGRNWNSESSPASTTEKVITSSTSRDTTVSEQIRVTQASEVLGRVPASNENVTPHKTGTYVCIAIIVVLLVGLIGFAIIKGQMRKRRDRRLLRQQKRDVERASKEMVDMNKSLLGKPATLEDPVERKINGKYELVPTHEIHQKKGENGDIANGINHNEPNTIRTDSPRDSNQNKSSSKDNNLVDTDKTVPRETSFESEPASPDSRKDSSSLASEEIFVPINDDESKHNGTVGSDISHPLINGDQNTDFLSPSQEYVPVYNTDLGRVRIKMAETPKPKTPVLVTRSRSNAGDIIITPSGDANARKSTT